MRAVPSTSSRCPCTRCAAAASERGSVTSNCSSSSVSGQPPPNLSRSRSLLARSRMVANTGGENGARGQRCRPRDRQGENPSVPGPPRCQDPLGAGIPMVLGPPWCRDPLWHSIVPLPLNLRAESAARRAASPSPMPEEQPVISTVVCSMGTTAAVPGPGGAALFKRAGQGPPPSLLPSVFCLPAYLKAPPPASLCLDAGSAAEIKTPRQSQGGGTGGTRGRQPRSSTPAGDSPEQQPRS